MEEERRERERNEGKERVERVRQTAERETCKFGGHESLNLLKDFDTADPEREREREWVAARRGRRAHALLVVSAMVVDPAAVAAVAPLISPAI